MILAGDHKQLIKFIDKLHIDTKELIKTSMKIALESKGGFQYESVLKMSAIERDIAIELINEKLKVQTKNPFAGLF